MAAEAVWQTLDFTANNQLRKTSQAAETVRQAIFGRRQVDSTCRRELKCQILSGQVRTPGHSVTFRCCKERNVLILSGRPASVAYMIGCS